MKKILILGLGESGTAALKLALKQGYHVTVYDDSPPALLNQKNREECIKNEIRIVKDLSEASDYSFIVTSPGVPLYKPQFAVLKNKEIISEVQFAWKQMKGDSIVITGSNGKSTTAALCEHILNSDGINSIACANFGIPLSQIAADDKYDNFVKVIEVSSFQLETMNNVRPGVSVCLDITENHLNRYDSFKAYEKAKLRLFRNNSKGSHWIISDQVLRQNSDLCNYQHLTSADTGELKGEINLRITEDGIEGDINIPFKIFNSQWRSLHNRQNLLIALGAASLLKGKLKNIKDSVLSFNHLHYRQEEVDNDLGLSIINDSKSTSSDSVIKAVNSFQKPMILIMGGRNKNNTFTDLKNTLTNLQVKTVIFGESREFIYGVLKDSVPCKMTETLEGAVKEAFALAGNEKTILFSPGCESFDQFKGYKDRGEQFEKFVKEMSRKKNKEKN